MTSAYILREVGLILVYWQQDYTVSFRVRAAVGYDCPSQMHIRDKLSMGEADGGSALVDILQRQKQTVHVYHTFGAAALLCP